MKSRSWVFGKKKGFLISQVPLVSYTIGTQLLTIMTGREDLHILAYSIGGAFLLQLPLPIRIKLS